MKSKEEIVALKDRLWEMALKYDDDDLAEARNIVSGYAQVLEWVLGECDWFFELFGAGDNPKNFATRFEKATKKGPLPYKEMVKVLLEGWER